MMDGSRRGSMGVPAHVLQSLLTMDDYDRTLSIDRIAREHGVSTEQLLLELKVLAQGGSSAPNPASEDFDSPHKSGVEIPELPTAAPRYISESANLRMRYDPSHQGLANQSKVSQAILCPTCSAPLGIPDNRPILVTCPNCMTESRFDD